MKTATATLSQLKLNPEINPRHVEQNPDVADIKAQIAHKGCIGQLWVRPIKGGKFEILDGGRRFHAMAQLAKEGAWKKDAKIPVNIFNADDGEAQDLAFSANFPRKALPPADEAVAFTRLVRSGMAIENVAAHYAVTEKLVRQRLAIGSLPEPILAALRGDAIDIGTAQLFTAHSAEYALKVFKDLAKKKSLGSWQVRHALEDGSISGSDRRCVFVGAAAYEAAGGVISRDLFSDYESWQDAKLLDRLFEAKIASEAQALKDAGWSFVEVMRKNTHQLHSWGKSVSKETRELTKEEKAELKKLKAEHKALIVEFDGLDDKSNDDELSDSETARCDALGDIIETIELKIEAFEQPLFSPREMQKAGCVITADEHGGPVEILRGLLKPGVRNQKSVVGEEEDIDEGGSSRHSPQGDGGTPETVEYSEALTKLLELEAQKATKLAMVTHKPALTARMGLAARCLALLEHSHDAPFKVHHSDTDCGDSFARIRVEGLKPFDGDASFTAVVSWLEILSPEEIMLIEAYLAADTFTVSSLKNPDVQAVLAMIDPDMTAEGFAPGAEFLGKLNRKQLLGILSEIDPAHGIGKDLKKPDLVLIVDSRANGAGWLPPPLRTPSYKGPGSNAWADNLAAKSAEEISQHPASPQATPDLRAADLPSEALAQEG